MIKTHNKAKVGRDLLVLPFQSRRDLMVLPLQSRRDVIIVAMFRYILF